ncbi:transposase [Nitrosomonas sp.]|uniref:transposase n=1 Tax=Nitrosomonas sp. TaxID=42353 RepID=UPI0025DE35E4|nr:transposase [Nitrosomonas sp.]
MEFGAEISVSLTSKGLAHVDKPRWNAQHEGHDLEAQDEAYKKRYGYYPEVVIADTLYGSRDNRSYLERNHIRFTGKPLGRSPKITPENKDELMRLKAQRRPEYRERIPIEGKFNQGEYGYRLNSIRAKHADTSAAWINSIFLVMNLLILMQVFICLRNLTAKIAFWVIKKEYAQRNPACACLPNHLKPEFLLGSAYLIAEFLSKLYLAYFATLACKLPYKSCASKLNPPILQLEIK